MGLNLMRRVGETIIVAEDIRITVKSIDGRQVQIEIDAPANISVDREEVYLRKRAERRSAAAKTLTLERS